MTDQAAHSGLGVASLLLALIGGALQTVLVTAAVLEERGGGTLAAMHALSAVMAFGLLLNLVGIGIGIASLFQRDRRHLPGLIGTIVNASVLVAVALVLGLLLGGRLTPAAALFWNSQPAGAATT